MRTVIHKHVLPLLVMLLAALPLAANADHACLENLPQGSTIQREHALPQSWFQVDGKSLVGAALHAALKKRYPSRYVTGVEEGEYGYLCARTADGYVAVSRSDFGNGVSYSSEAPRCMRCGASIAPARRFASGSGLRLGQHRAQVAALVGSSLAGDVVNLEFNELQPGPGKRQTWHTEVLRIEFANDVLVRFSVFDYREVE